MDIYWTLCTYCYLGSPFYRDVLVAKIGPPSSLPVLIARMMASSVYDIPM